MVSFLKSYIGQHSLNKTKSKTLYFSCIFVRLLKDGKRFAGFFPYFFGVFYRFFLV